MPDTALAPTLRAVIGRQRESPDTVSLTVSDDGPRAEPGQFHMLWSPGVGEVPISVSRLGEDTTTFTVRAVGTVTASLCAAEREATLGVRGPLGRGWDLAAPTGHDLLVVAGGLGLAPVRPVVDVALADPARYRSVKVLVGSRDPGSILFGDELDEWARLLEVRRSVDIADSPWRWTIGPITALLDGAVDDPDRTHVVTCGPEIMMRVVAEDLVGRGVDARRIQVSLERTMHCGVGHCGHCQLGPLLVCVDGPVTTWDRIGPSLRVAER